MTKRLIASAALACGLLLPNAHATNFNYNHIQINVLANPSGLGGLARFAFMEGAHFVAKGDTQFEGDWYTSAGAGFHAPVNEFVDLYGEIEAAWLRRPEDDKHDTGDIATVIGGGARAWIAPPFEATMYVGSIIFDKDDSESIVELGGRFHSTEALSLGATWRANGLEENRLIFSVRYLY
ncbi:hypothetical protein BZJ19_08150 [Salinivibrio proteolyticus]|uniref:hypothetical protein n=1 Tax=Salinivibrio proteolyticus TaxID=334715 RepID=UPI0009890AAF|nr:hypothetical protein [Salinivibrio proteolyticus]OOF25600.1 hypothetical protein BZJ19_08150 [Salinivibrio proteolyticus]